MTCARNTEQEILIPAFFAVKSVDFSSSKCFPLSWRMCFVFEGKNKVTQAVLINIATIICLTDPQLSKNALFTHTTD